MLQVGEKVSQALAPNTHFVGSVRFQSLAFTCLLIYRYCIRHMNSVDILFIIIINIMIIINVSEISCKLVTGISAGMLHIAYMSLVLLCIFSFSFFFSLFHVLTMGRMPPEMNVSYRIVVVVCCM